MWVKGTYRGLSLQKSNDHENSVNIYENGKLYSTFTLRNMVNFIFVVRHMSNVYMLKNGKIGI